MLNIITKLMSENDCYKAGRTITPRGITIHSTAEPGMRAGVWYELWNKSASERACICGRRNSYAVSALDNARLACGRHG